MVSGRRFLRGNAATALAIGLLASAVPGRGQEPQAIVTEVRVLDGNPIAGVKDGVIYRQTCKSGPGTMQPLSAALDVPARLRVEIGTCPPGSPPPRTICQAEIGSPMASTIIPIFPAAPAPGPALRSDAVEGERQIAVPLPRMSATGAYQLSLSCTVQGKSLAPLQTTLYVTYQRPIEMVAVLPPPASWYQTACSWGTGLTLKDSEAAVLQTMLQGMYAAGQQQWRYSLCWKADGGGCNLSGQFYPANQLNCADTLPYCKCHWHFLVGTIDPSQDCNFTDCFGFTSIFHYLAAVQGIGGLVPFAERGRYKRGFTTPPTLRSLDPAYRGNVNCGYRDNQACAYFFGIHSLQRRRDPKRIYDATFGAIYQDLGQIVQQSLTCWSQPGLAGELESFGIAPTSGILGYGFFIFYNLVPKTLACAAPDVPPQPARAEMMRPPRWGSKPVPTRQGGEPDTVPVELDVKVVRPGTYTVTAGLFAGQEPVSLHAMSHMMEAPVRITATWPEGLHTVRLVFSGEDLLQGPKDRPWTLRAVLQQDGETLHAFAADMAQLPSAFLPILGEREAWFPAGAQMKPTIGIFQGQRALEVAVPVHVKKAGPYFLQGRLARGEQTIVYKGSRFELATGDQEVSMEFPAAEIVRRGIYGEYDVMLEVNWLGSQGDPIEFEDALEQEIGTYGATDFR